MSSLFAIPILVLGVILVILGRASITEAMEQEIRAALISTARNAADMYLLAYPGEIEGSSEGQFHMGDTDLYGDTKLAQHIKDNAGTDITVFYGDTRVLTTIEDESGEQLTGTKIEDANIYKTIQSGNEYYSKQLQINGVRYYGYYVPLYSGEEVVGMVFAGVTNSSVSGSAQTMIMKIVIVFVVMYMFILAIISLYSRGLVRRLGKISNYINDLAEEHLDGKMDDSLLKRHDEISDMAHKALEVGDRIQTLIYKDFLTGLYNRRAGRIELSKAIEKADYRPDRHAVTLALGDIDFFKKVNDTYGHDVGDEVLVAVSDILKKHLDGRGFPTRWGGEEFLLTFKADFETSKSILEDILEDIRQTPFQHGELIFHVTMTFGITPYKKGVSIDDLVKKSDDLLYYGKTHGRNQIVSE